MYSKLVKKYSLYKIFTISLPSKKFCNPTYYLMCTYLIQTTPFLNLRFLLNEFYKLIYLFKLQLEKNNIIFFGSKKIFFLKSTFLIKSKFTYLNWNILNYKYLPSIEKNSIFACIYSLTLHNKLLYLIKDLKILTLGFINYQIPFNFLDYVFPLQCSSFTNIYFFHFTLKKFLNNAKN